MSMRPKPIGPVPEGTARVAEAAFPKGNLYMQMRDVLGTIYDDEARLRSEAFRHHGNSVRLRRDGRARLVAVQGLRIQRQGGPHEGEVDRHDTQEAHET
jgi:hypothetical protein